MSIFRRRRNRIEHAQERAAESDRQRDHAERQWPEVRDLMSWAKETREMNHLTELFLTSRGQR